MKQIAIFLCDITGKMAEPWVAAGYDVILVDPQHPAGITVETATSGATITKVGHVIDDAATWRVLHAAILTGRVVFVMGFPPCTDVAVSGSLHFERKRQKDIHFQAKAALVAAQCQIVGQLSGARWAWENPVSVFSSIFGKARHSFHPWHFTGIFANDNYTKNTQIWSSEDFEMPEQNVHPKVAEAIALVKSVCGGKMPAKPKALEATANNELVAEWYPDDRIHKCAPGEDRANFRSATPMGFSMATFLANAPHFKISANDNSRTEKFCYCTGNLNEHQSGCTEGFPSDEPVICSA